MAIKKSDLYSSLWASCDELRGGMDASQYKDYVLFMLFIKYISDKYGDSDDFAPPVVIPKGASFKDMVALKGNSDIGNLINTQVIQPLIDENSRLARSDFPDFNDSNKLGDGAQKVEKLGNLIAIFENPALDFSKNRAENDDILGDAYEYLMRHFATESGKSKGQFYTPSEVSRVIVKKRDLKQAAMQQLLTGQTRLPGFHGEWEETQVQDTIAGFFCGPSPTCEERNIHDDEWGVLKTTAATKENGWDWMKHKTLPRIFGTNHISNSKKAMSSLPRQGPSPSRRCSVGDYVPPRIIVSGKMIGLRPRPDKVAPLMLTAAISAREAQVYLDQRTTGMAESQVNFENTVLFEAPIRIPRTEEQTAIAEVLTEMDGELAVLEQRREKTRALKQARMQELLTGRTRLVPAGAVHA